MPDQADCRIKNFTIFTTNGQMYIVEMVERPRQLFLEKWQLLPLKSMRTVC